ncbi:RHS repeat-associated core domain-containing protein [Pseudomonas sp.]|uniref:RHS repeat-associated core domain-containing protein n=1 Tax=Pseudomonas sp. TaxID=306 RepID=UPI00391C71D6
MTFKAVSESYFFQSNRLAVAKSKLHDLRFFCGLEAPISKISESRSTRVSQPLRVDQLNSVIGTTLEHTQTYSAYGFSRHMEDSSSLGFNGERLGSDGLYLLGNGYRAYNPALMRFHNADSLSPFEQGGTNAYAYCSNDPINRVDPDGHAYIFSLNLFRSRKTVMDRRKAVIDIHSTTINKNYQKILDLKQSLPKGVFDTEIDLKIKNLSTESKASINIITRKYERVKEVDPEYQLDTKTEANINSLISLTKIRINEKKIRYFLLFTIANPKA